MNGKKIETSSQTKMINMRNLNVQPTTDTRGAKKFWETGPTVDFIMEPDDERKFSRQPDMSLQMQELFEEFNKIHLIKTGQSLPSRYKKDSGAGGGGGYLKPNSSPVTARDIERVKGKLEQRESWRELPDIWSDSNQSQVTTHHRPLKLSKSLEISPSHGILKKTLTLSKSWNDVTNTKSTVRKLSSEMDIKSLSDSGDAISPSVYRRYVPKNVEIMDNKANDKKLLHRTRHQSYDRLSKFSSTTTNNLLTVPTLPPVSNLKSTDKLKIERHAVLKRTKSDTK